MFCSKQFPTHNEFAFLHAYVHRKGTTPFQAASLVFACWSLRMDLPNSTFHMGDPLQVNLRTFGQMYFFPIFPTSGVHCEQIGNEKRENTKSWAWKGWGLRRQTHFLFPPDHVPVTHFKCVTCLVLQKSRDAVSPEGCSASPTKPGLNWKSFVLFSSALTHTSQAVQPAPTQL